MTKAMTTTQCDGDQTYHAVRTHVAQFRRTNGGLNPTRDQVAKALSRRKADICIAMNRLEEAEAMDAARLAVLPELPESVRESSEAMIVQLWTAANESASVAVGELRRHIADCEHRHTRQLSATTETLANTEDELDATRELADAAATDLAAARKENARLSHELARALAKLEEREALVELIRAEASAPAHASEPEGAVAGDGEDSAGPNCSAKVRKVPRKSRQSATTAAPILSPDGEPASDVDEPQTGLLPVPDISRLGLSDADDPSA